MSTYKLYCHIQVLFFCASFISLESRLIWVFLLFMLFHFTFCIYTQYTCQNQKLKKLNRCRLSWHVHCSIFFNRVTSPHNIFLLDHVNITCSCFFSGLKGFLHCLCLSMPTAVQWRQSPVNCFFDQFWHQSAPMGMWPFMWWQRGRFLSLWMLTTPLSLVWSAELT